MAPRRRILVVTPDTLSNRMAGPAIRAWHMAEDLAAEHDVTLLSATGSSLESDAFTVATTGSPDEVARLAAAADTAVVQGDVLDRFPALTRDDLPLVVDLYDPFLFEQLEQTRGMDPIFRAATVESTRRSLIRSLGRGDLFLCASDKQRDLWIGHLATVGRLNAVTYDDDPTVRHLLRVVPFGLPDHPPRQTRHAIKGSVPGVSADNLVVLWGGGVYDWLDPITVIEAVASLAERLPGVRLVFLGMRHPNPAVPEMEMARRARAVAAELGVAGTSVHFLEGWVPYAERADWLLDADVAVTAHRDHLETAYAFRTRVLDYLWAGIPVVATAGDTLADLIERHGLGITVAPGDAGAMAAALESLLTDPAARASAQAALRSVAPRYTWSSAFAPLREFCADPRCAPDRSNPYVRRQLDAQRRAARPPGRLARELEFVRASLDDGGLAALGRRMAGRLDRRLGRRHPPVTER